MESIYFLYYFFISFYLLNFISIFVYLNPYIFYFI